MTRMGRRVRLDWRGLAIVLSALSLTACVDYTPKPRGYFRIEPAAPTYSLYVNPRFPFEFHLSDQATALPAPADSLPWLNLVYPALEARVYCGYWAMGEGDFPRLEAESRVLVERSARDLRMVRERAYENPERRVYGSLFLVDGPSASPAQFYLTDSARHFFRGALYFDQAARPDSLRPVVDYLLNDLVELIETFNWK